MLMLKELSSLPGVSVIGRKRTSVLISLVRDMPIMSKNHSDSSNLTKDPRVVEFEGRNNPLDEYLEGFFETGRIDSLADFDDNEMEKLLLISRIMQVTDELSVLLDAEGMKRIMNMFMSHEYY